VKTEIRDQRSEVRSQKSEIFRSLISVSALIACSLNPYSLLAGTIAERRVACEVRSPDFQTVPVFSGETMDLAVRFTDFGSPMDLSSAQSVVLHVVTNNMPAGYSYQVTGQVGRVQTSTNDATNGWASVRITADSALPAAAVQSWTLLITGPGGSLACGGGLFQLSGTAIGTARAAVPAALFDTAGAAQAVSNWAAHALQTISLTPGPPGTNGVPGHSPLVSMTGDQVTVDGSIVGPHLTGPQGLPGSGGGSSSGDASRLTDPNTNSWVMVTNGVLTLYAIVPAICYSNVVWSELVTNVISDTSQSTALYVTLGHDDGSGWSFTEIYRGTQHLDGFWPYSPCAVYRNDAGYNLIIYSNEQNGENWQGYFQTQNFGTGVGRGSANQHCGFPNTFYVSYNGNRPYVSIDWVPIITTNIYTSWHTNSVAYLGTATNSTTYLDAGSVSNLVSRPASNMVFTLPLGGIFTEFVIKGTIFNNFDKSKYFYRSGSSEPNTWEARAIDPAPGVYFCDDHADDPDRLVTVPTGDSILQHMTDPINGSVSSVIFCPSHQCPYADQLGPDVRGLFFVYARVGPDGVETNEAGKAIWRPIRPEWTATEFQP